MSSGGAVRAPGGSRGATEPAGPVWDEGGRRLQTRQDETTRLCRATAERRLTVSNVASHRGRAYSGKSISGVKLNDQMRLNFSSLHPVHGVRWSQRADFKSVAQ